MIVMKFGGSSLASASSIERVVSIVRSQESRRPVVVTSAMGNTTDRLLDLLSAAQKGNSYAAWKLQDAIKNEHFAVCERLLHGPEHSAMDQYLRATFRDLHVRTLELCEGERIFNKELQDWTVSLGEQLSSRLLASILREHCGETMHLDSRKLIVTDSAFTNAQLVYKETYARIRWAILAAARDKLVVLGGFIGGTEDGRTTTLGRGGSDLTASVVGAGIHAEEIQVWKDVDGMLTCDPRILPGAHRVKKLSYEEASELASAGATILHPETMAPAERLHIPIVVRNTFYPSSDGTRIDGCKEQPANLMKSIAVKSDVTLLEIRCANGVDGLDALNAFCKQNGSDAAVLFSSERVLYIGLNEKAKISEQNLASSCLEVRMRSRQAILTIVGQFSDKQLVAKKLSAAVQGTPSFIIPSEKSSCSIRLAVAQERLQRTIAQVHNAFFSNPDPQFFVTQNAVAKKQVMTPDTTSPRYAEVPKTFVLSTGVLQRN